MKGATVLIVKGRGVHLHVEGESLVYIGTFFGADGAAWARKFVKLFNAADERTEEEATTIKVPMETWRQILDALVASETAPTVDRVSLTVRGNPSELLWDALEAAKEIDL